MVPRKLAIKRFLTARGAVRFPSLLRRLGQSQFADWHDRARSVVDQGRSSGVDRRMCSAAATVRFALASGCRASEIVGLEWNRVDVAQYGMVEPNQERHAERRSAKRATR